MNRLKTASLVTLLLAAGGPAFAQAPKISGLVQGWYTQKMDSNLSYNSGAYPDYYYSNVKAGGHTQNGFFFKRIDLKATGSIGDVDYEVFIDPTINAINLDANSTDSIVTPILQDGYLKYRAPFNIEVKVGQFKTLQTQEANSSSAELMLAERSLLARTFGDVRDRGVLASIGFGDPKALGGRATVGVFNGSAKGNVDTNPQKDFVARLDMNFGKAHTFGAYTMQASTGDISVPGATPEELGKKDATSNMGAFYRYQTDKYHAAVEFITGTLGRRITGREHLNQQFMGYVATAGYAITNKHRFVLRYDYLNYNSGDDWYGDASPYVNPVRAGVQLTGDFTPAYTETTLGYIYALADHYRQACVRVNYIMRSKNFLAKDGQIGGGDSLVIAYQVGF
jgi:hypothetical protein